MPWFHQVWSLQQPTTWSTFRCNWATAGWVTKPKKMGMNICVYCTIEIVWRIQHSVKNIVAKEQNAWTIGAGNFGEVRLGQDLRAETRSKVVELLKIGWIAWWSSSGLRWKWRWRTSGRTSFPWVERWRCWRCCKNKVEYIFWPDVNKKELRTWWSTHSRWLNGISATHLFWRVGQGSLYGKCAF